MRSTLPWLALSFLAVSVHAASEEWTAPEAGDISGSLSPKTASADFDGDGLQDFAELKVNRVQGTMALFVSLGSLPETSLRIGEPLPLDAIRYQGLGILPPGRYETLCGKGYHECAQGEPAALNPELPSLELYVEESASSMFLYDESSATFRQFWLSD